VRLDRLLTEYKIGDGYTLFVKLRERAGEAKKKSKKSKSTDAKGKKPTGSGQSSVAQEEVNEGIPIDALILEFLQFNLGALGLQTNRHMAVVSAPNPSQPTTMMGSVANAIGMGATLSPATSSTLTADKKKNSKSASSEVGPLPPSFVMC
jgi:hypothetical protein